MTSPVRIQPITAPPSIEIDRSQREYSDDARKQIDTAWGQLCDRNPRYFNGSMLAFDSFDPSTSTLYASAEEYRHHAVRDTVNLGISLLAVTGVLFAMDNGHSKYMIGKRATTTHRYGDLWEFGPCGGIDVPGDSIDGLDFDAVVAELGREAMEEAGINLAGISARPVALVHDDLVGSTDIVIRVDLPMIPGVRVSWEYSECRWISLNELGLWMESNPEAFIPTTIAIAGLLLADGGYD